MLRRLLCIGAMGISAAALVTLSALQTLSARCVESASPEADNNSDQSAEHLSQGAGLQSGLLCMYHSSSKFRGLVACVHCCCALCGGAAYKAPMS